MKYGYFDDENKEYVITRPDTPLPWINYLGSESYFGIISNTAGGFSFYKDARFRRLTRYRYNNVPTDFGGRYIYIRDNINSEFWSPTWQPTRSKLDQYNCRHGLGYTIISSIYKNIGAKIRYFVPLGDDLEIWQLTLKNHRENSIDLSIFSCVEFCLWDAQDDATNFQRNLNVGEVEIEDGVIYHKTEYRERRNHFAYFGCSESIDGFDTQREKFLGSYQSWERPTVVEKGQSFNSKTHGWTPIGSHHIKLNLEPGEKKQIIFILGYHENSFDQKFDPIGSQTINKKTVKKVLTKYLNPINIDNAFKALNIYWDNLLNKLHVSTPDVHTNRMVNIWNPYQCMITFKLSRSVSFFESGIGRGIGFRDSNQDILSFAHIAPSQTKERILDLATTQLKTGGAYHQYQPLTKKGNDAIGSGFNDDPLWLVLSVASYLKETGDWSILDEQVPFENEPGTEEPLLKHLQYSLQYVHERLGPHGLPLIGRADWNDCLNLNCFSDLPDQSFQTIQNKEGKVAESVFIAALFIIATKEFVNILQQKYSVDASKGFFEWAETMRSTILKHGWDGEWFIRAYDDYGNKVGSQECEEGQIYIEPQGFCVFAKVGIKEGLAKKALKSVKNKLVSRHGIMLLQPPYTKYYLHLGEISSYPPGYKENGSIFCHTNPWIMIAETMVGNGDAAHDYYTLINPSAREEISEVHRCEPYIYAQTIAGKDAPTFGEAKNSWLTGTASWNFIAITNYILGILPVYNGLCISPIIPKNWSGFKATRIFRNVKYQISVERVGLGNKSIIYVNDKQIEGNIIPIPPEGIKNVVVNVEIA
ncbi:MAG: glycosyl transferase [Candidatus Lokiarchaeota archaeon]|nr:glycosyl transferase [Candidatus Lokiarchaeota archaeon]